MGRAEKAKARRRAANGDIRLEELDYLRLVKARSHIDAALLEGQRVIQQAEQRVVAVRERFAAELQSAAKKYGFDPAVSYRMDDDACRLIPEDPTTT